MSKVSVANDFSRFPSGRYKRNGNTSGEGFRQRYLESALQRGESVVVELDGTIGYGSSFLEEAFGGVIRSLNLPASQILARLDLRSSDSELIDEIKQYIEDAGKARKGGN